MLSQEELETLTPAGLTRILHSTFGIALLFEETASGCWYPFGKKTTIHGYSYVSIKNKQFRLHRLAYQAVKGNFDQDLLVRHECDNRPCCNPKHLLIGTNKDNSEDMVRRQRCNQPRGVHNYAAKLTEEEVLEIRASQLPQYELAIMYNMSQQCISKVRNRTTYKNVLDREESNNAHSC